MNRGLLNTCILLTLLAFSAGRSPQASLGAGSDDAWLAISDAETSVIDCYRALYDAGRDGANITELISILNEAGWLLSKAKLAYYSGDYESAIGYAGECLSMLEGFIEQAEILRLKAKEASWRDFMFNFVGSSIGALFIAVGGYAVWLYLVRREDHRGMRDN